MKLSTLLVFALIAFVAMAHHKWPTFSDYKTKQSLKFTSPAEEAFRFVVYGTNLMKINVHNSDPKRTYD